METISNKTIVPSPLDLPSPPSTTITRLSNHYRHESNRLPTQQNNIGWFGKIHELVPQAPSSVKHSQLSVFQPLARTTFIHEFLRQTTAFIARNYYWIKWVIYIPVIAFFVFAVVPALPFVVF